MDREQRAKEPRKRKMYLCDKFGPIRNPEAATVAFFRSFLHRHRKFLPRIPHSELRRFLLFAPISVGAFCRTLSNAHLLRFFTERPKDFHVDSLGNVELRGAIDLPSYETYTEDLRRLLKQEVQVYFSTINPKCVKDNSCAKCNFSVDELSLSSHHFQIVEKAINFLQRSKEPIPCPKISSILKQKAYLVSFFNVFRPFEITEFFRLHSNIFVCSPMNDIALAGKKDDMYYYFKESKTQEAICHSLEHESVDFFVYILFKEGPKQCVDLYEYLIFAPGFVIQHIAHNYSGPKFVRFFLNHKSVFHVDESVSVNVVKDQTYVNSNYLPNLDIMFDGNKCHKIKVSRLLFLIDDNEYFSADDESRRTVVSETKHIKENSLDLKESSNKTGEPNEKRPKMGIHSLSEKNALPAIHVKKEVVDAEYMPSNVMKITSIRPKEGENLNLPHESTRTSEMRKELDCHEGSSKPAEQIRKDRSKSKEQDEAKSTSIESEHKKRRSDKEHHRESSSKRIERESSSVDSKERSRYKDREEASSKSNKQSKGQDKHKTGKEITSKRTDQKPKERSKSNEHIEISTRKIDKERSRWKDRIDASTTKIDKERSKSKEHNETSRTRTDHVNEGRDKSKRDGTSFMDLDKQMTPDKAIPDGATHNVELPKIVDVHMFTFYPTVGDIHQVQEEVAIFFLDFLLQHRKIFNGLPHKSFRRTLKSASTRVREYCSFLSDEGLLKFFTERFSHFLVDDRGFVRLSSEVEGCEPSDTSIKTLNAFFEHEMCKDNSSAASASTSDSTPLTLSSVLMDILQQSILILLDSEKPMSCMELTNVLQKDPEIRYYFSSFKPGDITSFYKLYPAIYKFNSDNSVCLVQEAGQLFLELKSSKTTKEFLITLELEALQFYLTLLKKTGPSSPIDLVCGIVYAPGYVMHHIVHNYSGVKFVKFFLNHSNIFSVDKSNRICVKIIEMEENYSYAKSIDIMLDPSVWIALKLERLLFVENGIFNLAKRQENARKLNQDAKSKCK